MSNKLWSWAVPHFMGITGRNFVEAQAERKRDVTLSQNVQIPEEIMTVAGRTEITRSKMSLWEH